MTGRGGIRQRVAQSFRNVFRNFARVKRAFEFVGSDEDVHGYNFIVCSFLSFRAKRGEVEESLDIQK